MQVDVVLPGEEGDEAGYSSYERGEKNGLGPLVWGDA